jgi:hypothetical protein
MSTRIVVLTSTRTFSRITFLKPCSSAVTVYLPLRRLENRKNPASLVTAVRVMLVCTSVAVTVTPGTEPPLESLMLPRSVPVTACAAAREGTRHSMASANAVANRVA